MDPNHKFFFNFLKNKISTNIFNLSSYYYNFTKPNFWFCKTVSIKDVPFSGYHTNSDPCSLLVQIEHIVTPTWKRWEYSRITRVYATNASFVVSLTQSRMHACVKCPTFNINDETLLTYAIVTREYYHFFHSATTTWANSFDIHHLKF